ncbi:hypothetical protein THAOC_20486, partial [Thalassiosira oceanica]
QTHRHTDTQTHRHTDPATRLPHPSQPRRTVGALQDAEQAPPPILSRRPCEAPSPKFPSADPPTSPLASVAASIAASLAQPPVSDPPTHSYPLASPADFLWLAAPPSPSCLHARCLQPSPPNPAALPRRIATVSNIVRRSHAARSRACLTWVA